MSDDKKLEKDYIEEYNLYTEKIVKKPSVKYQKVIQIGKTLLRLAAYTGVAFFAFTILYPLIESRLAIEPARPEIVIPKDEYPDWYAQDAYGNNVVETTVKRKEIGTDELNQIMSETRKSIVKINANYIIGDILTGGSVTKNTTAGLIIYEIDSEYIILTNNDIITGAASISVSFGDSTNAVPASIIRGNSETGIAVIAVKESDLTSKINSNVKIAVLDNSYLVRPGDIFITSGKLKGDNISSNYGTITDISNGVSGIDSFYGLLTTNIAKNAGDYAYLFNTDGNVIGISKNSDTFLDSKGISETKEASDLIIAYGISDLKALIQELTHGESIAYLGVYGSNVTSFISKEHNNLPIGAYVEDVIENSPAYAAGIQKGDVIISINDEPISTFKALSETLYKYIYGDTVIVTVKRLGKDEYKSIPFSVTLGAK